MSDPMSGPLSPVCAYAGKEVDLWVSHRSSRRLGQLDVLCDALKAAVDEGTHGLSPLPGLGQSLLCLSLVAVADEKHQGTVGQRMSAIARRSAAVTVTRLHVPRTQTPRPHRSPSLSRSACTVRERCPASVASAPGPTSARTLPDSLVAVSLPLVVVAPQRWPFGARD